MVKHPWPLLEISLPDFRELATLNINTYLPTYLPQLSTIPENLILLQAFTWCSYFSRLFRNQGISYVVA